MEKKKHEDFKMLALGVIGLALAIIVSITFGEISTQALGLFFSSVLVIVTIWYAANTKSMAKSANEQAKASVKMAKEMRIQRYATALPVVDILAIDEMGRTATVRIAEAKAKSKGAKTVDEIAPTTHLTCLLRNIGVGPATDVFSFITVTTLSEVGSKEHCEFRRLGSLETGANLKDIGNERWHLFLMQKNRCKFLVIYYFDVYGRCFESSREVTRDETTGELKINPLKVTEIEGKECELLVQGKYMEFVDKLWTTSKSQEALQ